MQRKFRAILVVLVLCGIGAAAMAAEVYCRSGLVVKSEVQTRQPAVSDLDPFALDEDKGPFKYLIVTIKPDAGRAFSIVDYAAVVKGTEYPCMALAIGSGEFSGSDRSVKDFGAEGTVRLMFRIDSSALGYRPDVTLRYKLATTGLVDTKLSF